MTTPVLRRAWFRLVRYFIPGAMHYPAEHRRLRLLWLDGVFSNVGEALVLAYIALYILAYGATNSQIGIQAAVINLMAAIAILPGVRLVERWGQPKQLVVLSAGVLGRLALLALVLIPFFFRAPVAIVAITLCAAARAFFNQLAMPAWSTLAARLVPYRLRGRYFTSRNFAMTVAALISVPLAGQVIARMGAPTGYQITFLLAFLAGIVATAAYSRIPEPEPQEHATGQGLDEEVETPFPLLERFAPFVASQFIWSMSLHAAAPFFNVYVIRGLHGTAADVGMLSAVFTLSLLVGLRFFRRQVARRGALWTMRVTGMVIPLLPWGWILVREVWHPALINLVGGFIWAGYDLGTLNLMLAIAPAPQRTRLVATYQTLIFGAAFIGPLIGGYVAENLGFAWVFFLSGLGRAVAAWILLRFVPSS